MHFGVIQFPGSNCDQDAYHALTDVLDQPTRYIWHKDASLGDVDCVVVPGGFSYGDYLRTGAIARFAPAMKAVIDHAKSGGLVIGICNGFQILCEAHLLPGALIRNRVLKFICDFVHVRVETTDSPFTNACKKGQVLRIPIAHGEGSYFAEPRVIEQLQRDDRILVRYCTKDGEITDAANPNGSLDNIAGICNETRNVFGLMPHPERASEELLGSDDGRMIFDSILQHANKGRREAVRVG
ncbi:MAG TPA: phosphoribosylformylglycinamidine synthase subunit PurQ [Verrucomicrobiae bacterium]|nr:phosphoribosylformylglycinamidine synthase subunit PurQ [Verrucomicrobiae bacterium]